MQNLEDANAPFELYNSPLSETACLGFEYGYSAATPERARPLGGPVRRLRQRRPGDHRQLHRLRRGEVGTDQPPHPAAAARLRGLRAGALERPRSSASWRSAAEGNIRIANPTTAAQYFHLLRRQALIRKPRPLVVFTPKGLLRLDRAAATPEELTEGRFHFILDDPTARTAARRSSD